MTKYFPVNSIINKRNVSVILSLQCGLLISRTTNDIIIINKREYIIVFLNDSTCCLICGISERIKQCDKIYCEPPKGKKPSTTASKQIEDNNNIAILYSRDNLNIKQHNMNKNS